MHSILPIKMLKQHHIVKIFTDEGAKGSILFVVSENIMARAMSKSEVYSCIAEMEQRKTNFNMILSRGRVSDKDFTSIIVRRLKQDYHLSKRKLIESLDIALTIMNHYLQDILGMKYLCL
jgi:hypothetical protein